MWVIIHHSFLDECSRGFVCCCRTVGRRRSMWIVCKKPPHVPQCPRKGRGEKGKRIFSSSEYDSATELFLAITLQQEQKPAPRPSHRNNLLPPVALGYPCIPPRLSSFMPAPPPSWSCLYRRSASRM